MMMSQAMATTTTTEEFSFPTTTDLYSCGIDSPPLWRLSPASSPDVFLDRKGKDCLTTEEKEEEDRFPYKLDRKNHERKSFSYVEKGSKTRSKKIVAENDEEEKMDSLWEDFNEELRRRSPNSKSSGDMVELGCNQALKLSRNNGAMLSPKNRPGMLDFMKVLRKLFVLHNHNSAQRSVKHRKWYT